MLSVAVVNEAFERRFWGTACPRDEVVYVVLFINERCLVFALSG